MENAWVYIRNWNILGYDKDVLKKYNLKCENYWYIGSTKETLAQRNAKFKYQMLNQKKSNSEHSEHYANNKTSIFINNLVKFYREELKLSEENIDKLVFSYFDTKKIELKDYYEYIDKDLKISDTEKLYKHQLFESKVIGQYIALSQLRDNRNKILSLKDGYVKIDLSNNKITAKLKNNSPIDLSLNISFEINSEKNYINVYTDLETLYEFFKQDIKALEHHLQNNDIIKQE